MKPTISIVEDVSTVSVLEDNTTVQVVEESVSVLTVGEQGPAGPPGTSGDANYTQSFTVANNVTVNHNLGKYPAVTVMDSAGDECEGSVDHISANQLIVSFSAPFSGIVVCN